MVHTDANADAMGSYRSLINIGRYIQKSHKSPPVDYSSGQNAALSRNRFLEKASTARRSNVGYVLFRSPIALSFIGLLGVTCLLQLHISYVLMGSDGNARELSLISRTNTESPEARKEAIKSNIRHTNSPSVEVSKTDKVVYATAENHPVTLEPKEIDTRQLNLRQTHDRNSEVDPILRPIIESGGTFYILNRRDRSGRVVGDMLYAHAFAFANNLTYGGLCWIQGRYKDEIFSLMEDLKWGNVLPLACPEGVDVEKYAKTYLPNEQNATEISPLILNTDVYKIHSNFKPEWVQKISKDLVDPFFMEKEEMMQSKRKPKPFEIAVHVRRGDIEPCHFSSRYLPNSYYLDIIDRYAPKENELDGRPLSITIYSESDSYESFDEFVERGYTLDLDTPKLGDVWRALSTADVAILSSSYFSVIPAIINPNIVIMPEYSQFEALEGWGVVHVSKQHRKLMTLMHQECMKVTDSSR
jgi:hypothetical protein